jgi:oligosaccharide repeat unit polymerase
VVLISFIKYKKENDNKSILKIFVICGVLINLIYSIYSQSRAGLLILPIQLIVISYFINNCKVPWKITFIFGAICISLFLLVTSLRPGSGYENKFNIDFLGLISPIIHNNGSIDASKTGHIINHLDFTQNFKYGTTLVDFIVAIVPRQLWIDKPVNIDTIIGMDVFNASIYGSGAVPPGFIAEMYINFWYVGVAFGLYILGMLMKVFNNTLHKNVNNYNFILIYVVSMMPFGSSVLGSSFSSVMIGVLMNLVPILFVLKYINIKSNGMAK